MNRRIFWGSVVLGGAVMTFGITGLVAERAAADTFAVARLVLGAAVVHDAVVAPVVFGLGLALSRLVPGWARGPVQSGLFVSAVVSLYAWPFVRGYGRAATNPSALPLRYGLGLAVILATVWSAVALAVALRAHGRGSPGSVGTVAAGPAVGDAVAP